MRQNESTRPSNQSGTAPPPQPLAICGIGCRFPGGIRNVETFWSFLCEGRSAITEVPGDRWNAERYFHDDPEASGKMITKWGGFVDQLKEFDAAFWGISPREASRMDPQQRWLLETAWEALEDAGVPPSLLRGSKTGVYVGISSNDYASMQLADDPHIDVHTNSGGTLSIAANRISYQFDLKGPSVAVDTACSSALVAIVQACQAIWSGECESALAGGVNALLSPNSSVGFSKANMLSPSGKCFAFDARADGYVRGEGAGLIFLQPLNRAIENGDRIYATIRAGIINQDGHSQTMTVPDAESQAAMLCEAYERAGLPPRRVAYVEAHGTGTPVGDPIEARALGEVLGKDREISERCPIGSVKTNLGHLESASGAAGLIKAALVLERGMIPPSLNFRTPNPTIPFDEWKLEVATDLRPLPMQNGLPPAASVNSFGFGGTNAHVVLEGSPIPDPEAEVEIPGKADRPLILPISARDDGALEAYVRAFHERLNDPSLDLAEACCSAGDRKEHHPERVVVLGRNAAEMRQEIERWLEGDVSTGGIVAGSAGDADGAAVFVFTGQGPQWWGMGRRLIAAEPLVREKIEEIDGLLEPLAGWSLAEELNRPESESRIGRTEIAQPAIFALQVALTELWKSWGIEPAAVVGHSVGEVAAAWCAGIFSLDDAVKIVFERSRLQEMTGGHGRMLAAGISPADAREVIGVRTGAVEITAINSPDLITLAGDTEPMEAIAREFESAGRFVRWLPVDHAFHSHQMEPIREELLGSLSAIRPQPETIPFFSTVTGDRIGGEDLDANYWWKNVRRPVLFASAISRLAALGESVFLEVGPHPSLRGALSQCLSGGNSEPAVFHSLRRDADDSCEILSQLAGLYLTGLRIDWAAVNQASGRLVRLPSYPWQYREHWCAEDTTAWRLLPEPHPFLGKRISSPLPTWQCDLDPHRFRYLQDHRIWDSMIFPASGYGEIGLALAAVLYPEESWAVEAVENARALFIPEKGLRTLQISFDPADQSFAVHSADRGSGEWELNARGRLFPVSEEVEHSPAADLDTIRSRLPDRIGPETIDAEFQAIGYQFGPEFCRIELLHRTEGEALAEIPVPDALRGGSDRYRFHPALLDACLQSSRGVQSVPPGADPKDHLFLPESIRRIRLFTDELPDRLWAHAVQINEDEQAIEVDIAACDREGRPVAEILGFRATRMKQKGAPDRIGRHLYRFEWLPREPQVEESSETAAPKTWLMVGSENALTDALVEQIEKGGASVIQIPADAEVNLEDLLDRWTKRDQTPDVVVHTASFDAPKDEEPEPDHLWDLQNSGVRWALRLGRALHANESNSTPRVYFALGGLASAPLSGFARVANNEHFENRWTTVESDATDPQSIAGQLHAEVSGAYPDLEVAFRKGVRQVRELLRTDLDDFSRRTRSTGPEEPDSVPFRLETSRPGTLADLSLAEAVRTEPGPDEVEIRVNAGGLNFRDVMKALGMYPGNPADLSWFGDDFAGTVIRTGDHSGNLQPGDRVAGIAPCSFRSHLTVNRHLLFKVPPEMSLEEAATFPTVFLTAHYALVELGHLRAGESILIHAGAGGVGQAAIQVARHLGLKIFTTAGSPEKRDFLKGMGVDHVFDSRSLAFADEILEITGGEGVDAVLNSLAGPFIPKSLSVLAAFGRFLEIGKTDVYGRSKIGLETLKNNISYHVIDLAQLLEKQPGRVAAMLSDLAAQFRDGTYRPLPRRVFPVSDAAGAFRFMAQAKQIGKVVLSFVPDHPLEIGPCTEEGSLFRAEAAYLVTGGAGGFGWETARWMAEMGARHLVLFSRTGPAAREAAEIDRLRAEGINIVDRRGDVADPVAVRETIDWIASQLPPLRGIVHAAMVLEDDFIVRIEEESLDRVLKPKLLGAWNLHRAARDCPLDHFICFSSFSSLIGGARQANYNAGNAFLDKLAEYRRSRGLPALTVNWGALRGAGFVERNRKTADYLEMTGMGMIPVAEALRMLRELLLRDPGSVGAARVDWEKLRQFSSLISRSPSYEPVVRESIRDSAGGSVGKNLLAIPPEERPLAADNFLTEKAATVLGIEPEQVDRSMPMTRLGLDSLMAVELVNAIESDLGLKIPMGRLMSGPTVSELSGIILDLLDKGTEGTEPTTGSAVGGCDFRADARLDSTILPGEGMASSSSDSWRNLLLTGATGFLGAFLLDELLRRTDAVIHCLVRADAGTDSLDRIRANLTGYQLDPGGLDQRVKTVEGDLSKPNLGLSEAEFDRLSQTIDAVYHCGAEVNLALPYDALRPSNVGGTREILRLACLDERAIPVHAVSTFTVHSTDANRGEIVTESDPLPACESLLYGYSQSKWVAEKLMEEARHRGLPVSIFRPGHIVGDSRSGASNRSDLLHTMALVCLDLGAAPLRDAEFDVTPVDYVARAIVEISRRDNLVGGTFHLTNPRPLQTRELTQCLGQAQIGIESVPFEEWRQRLLESNGAAPAEALKILTDFLAPRVFSHDEAKSVHARFDCRHTLEALEGTGISCPPADRKWISVYLKHLQTPAVDALSSRQRVDQAHESTDGTPAVLRTSATNRSSNSRASSAERTRGS